MHGGWHLRPWRGHGGHGGTSRHGPAIGGGGSGGSGGSGEQPHARGGFGQRVDALFLQLLHFFLILSTRFRIVLEHLPRERARFFGGGERILGGGGGNEDGVVLEGGWFGTLSSSSRVSSVSGAWENMQSSPLMQLPVVWKSLQGKSRELVKEEVIRERLMGGGHNGPQGVGLGCPNHPKKPNSISTGGQKPLFFRNGSSKNGVFIPTLDCN